MSTNFYLHTKGDVIHIGKRSAAGLYCRKCNITTCTAGEEHVHTGKGSFSKTCLECFRPVTTSICSFSWAIAPHKLALIHRHDLDSKIFDEYGTPIRLLDFEFNLQEKCPIQYYDSIGTEFC